MKIFGKKIFEKRKLSFQDEIEKWPSLFGLFQNKSKSGVNVTEFRALQMSVVYACIRLISNTIAMLPLTLHQEIGENSRLAINKPLYKVLYKLANKEITAFTFKQTMQSHVLMWGNAYAEIVINGGGEVIELWPLAPWNMQVELKNGEKKFKYTSPENEIIFDSEQIFHLPGLSFDGIIGYSPLKVMKEEIGLGIGLQEFGSTYFRNGANIGGVVEHPGRLGEKARIHLKEDLQEKFTGLDNALRLMILEEGMRYNKIGIPAEDAQFIQSRKFELEEICRYFGVQLHMIQNLDRASFNNIEHQGIEFVTYCLGPWAAIWEQNIYKSLLNIFEQSQNYYAKFNFNALMRGDYKTRMEGYRTGVQMGLYSLNDVRKFEDLNPIPKEAGGDIHWVNSAMIPIEMQLNGPKKNILNIGGDNKNE